MTTRRGAATLQVLPRHWREGGHRRRSFTYPGEFLNEVLSRSWEAGWIRYVSLIGVHVDSTPRELDRMEKLFKSILESVAETPLVICLGRDNKLDMYVSTVQAP